MAGDEERLDRFEGTIGELRGRLGALEAQVARIQDRTPVETDRHGGLKSAITFVSIVIVPIIVALLGGWFALKSAGLR